MPLTMDIAHPYRCRQVNVIWPLNAQFYPCCLTDSLNNSKSNQVLDYAGSGGQHLARLDKHLGGKHAAAKGGEPGIPASSLALGLPTCNHSGPVAHSLFQGQLS